MNQNWDFSLTRENEHQNQSKLKPSHTNSPQSSSNWNKETYHPYSSIIIHNFHPSKLFTKKQNLAHEFLLISPKNSHVFQHSPTQARPAPFFFRLSDFLRGIDGTLSAPGTSVGHPGESWKISGNLDISRSKMHDFFGMPFSWKLRCWYTKIALSLDECRCYDSLCWWFQNSTWIWKFCYPWNLRGTLRWAERLISKNIDADTK